MGGYDRVRKASKFNTPSRTTPFGKMEELRSEVESVVSDVVQNMRLPVVTFSAGGIATPADAALMMNHGMDGVFVGSGIFKSSDPANTAEAIVMATHHYNDPSIVSEACSMLSLIHI